MFLRFTPLFATLFFFVFVSLTPASLEAQGYFRIVRPVDTERQPLSATLIPLSVSPEIDTAVPSQNLRNSVVGTDGRTRAALPTPRHISLEQQPDALFRRGTVRGILAWNGKSDGDGEALLILSSDLVSATGQDEAVIGILPLPGKPTAVTRVSDDIFHSAKRMIDGKIEEIVGPPGGHVPRQPIVYPSIANYSISVLEFSDIDRFSEDVNSLTRTFFDPSVRVVIDDKAMESIKQYWERGFRYFSFDVSQLGRQPLSKTAVAYRFQSSHAFYPLAISSIGGTGHGLIDLIVITPGSINLGGAFEQGKEEAPILVRGHTAVDFTMEELRELEPMLADVFKTNGLSSVRVRNFLFNTDDIGGFKNDFVGVNAEPPVDPEVELPLENADSEISE